jgi:L-alanine-DL-glutamate epimerase-like enolase superfamily enzyme
MGGISEVTKVIPLASVHKIRVMTHRFYDGPSLLAAIHVIAAIGTADSMIEWRYFDLETQLYGDALSAERRRIRVLQAPGWEWARIPTSFVATRGTADSHRTTETCSRWLSGF